jgi:hypothetical protein
LLLHKSDDAKQPLARGGLQFLLRTPLIKRIYGVSAAGKRNVAAGKTGFAAILRHELHQPAFGAGLRVVRIVEIEAGGRILENKMGRHGKRRAFPSPPESTKASSAPQDLENIAPVRHRKIPGGQVRIKLALTHEEIAQMIGSSRETVTRLADFRRRQLVQVMGSTLVIKNKSALEGIVTG